MNKWLTDEEIMTILTDILKKRTFCDQRNEYVIPEEVILFQMNKIAKIASGRVGFNVGKNKTVIRGVSRHPIRSFFSKLFRS